LIFIIGDSGTHVNIWNLKYLQMLGKVFVGKVAKKLKCEGNRLWVVFEDTSLRRYNLSEYTIEVEMQALHRQSVNAIDFNLRDHLLYTVGDDSLLKVWDYSFQREPHQVFIGHAHSINDIIYRNEKIWTVGNEGVLVWRTNQPMAEFVPQPLFKK
jgi:WD40 repeat protein